MAAAGVMFRTGDEKLLSPNAGIENPPVRYRFLTPEQWTLRFPSSRRRATSPPAFPVAEAGSPAEEQVEDGEALTNEDEEAGGQAMLLDILTGNEAEEEAAGTDAEGQADGEHRYTRSRSLPDLVDATPKGKGTEAEEGSTSLNESPVIENQVTGLGTWFLWGRNQRLVTPNLRSKSINEQDGSLRKLRRPRSSSPAARLSSPSDAALEGSSKVGASKRRRQLLPFPVFSVKRSSSGDTSPVPVEEALEQQLPEAVEDVKETVSTAPGGEQDDVEGVVAASNVADIPILTSNQGSAAQTQGQLPFFIHQWDLCFGGLPAAAGEGSGLALPTDAEDSESLEADLDQGEVKDASGEVTSLPVELEEQQKPTHPDTESNSAGDREASQASSEDVETSDLSSRSEDHEHCLSSQHTEKATKQEENLLTDGIKQDPCTEVDTDKEITVGAEGESASGAGEEVGGEAVGDKKATEDEGPCEHDVLEKNLKLSGFTQLYMAGDGNCQFRSVSDQLFGTPDKHQQVRKAVVAHIKQNKGRYSPYISDVSFEDYILEAGKDGTWGDHITLQAAADRYKAKITLITAFQDKYVVEILPADVKPRVEIYLSYYSGRHFNSARALGKACSRGALAERRIWFFPLF